VFRKELNNLGDKEKMINRDMLEDHKDRVVLIQIDQQRRDSGDYLAIIEETSPDFVRLGFNYNNGECHFNRGNVEKARVVISKLQRLQGGDDVLSSHDRHYKERATISRDTIAAVEDLS